MPVFETYRFVAIEDNRLGWLYYGSILGLIVCYSISVFIEGNYLEFDFHPPADVFSKLKSPEILNREGLAYCDIEGWNCEIRDPYEMGSSSSSSMFVVSAEHRLHEERVCAKDASRCEGPHWKRLGMNFSATVAPEDHILAIEHSIGSGRFGNQFATSSKMTEGEMKMPNGETIVFPTSSLHDDIPLSTLLEASGISLDDESDFDFLVGGGQNEKKHKSSYRFSGVVLHLDIHYTNINPKSFGKLKYFYSVTKATGVRARVSDVEIIDENERVQTRQFGIKIVYHVSGKLGKVTVGAITPHVAFVGTAMTICYTIVLYLALYLFKYDGHIYAQAKEEETSSASVQEIKPKTE